VLNKWQRWSRCYWQLVACVSSCLRSMSYHWVPSSRRTTSTVTCRTNSKRQADVLAHLIFNGHCSTPTLRHQSISRSCYRLKFTKRELKIRLSTTTDWKSKGFVSVVHRSNACRGRAVGLLFSLYQTNELDRFGFFKNHTTKTNTNTKDRPTNLFARFTAKFSCLINSCVMFALLGMLIIYSVVM